MRHEQFFNFKKLTGAVFDWESLDEFKKMIRGEDALPAKEPDNPIHEQSNNTETITLKPIKNVAEAYKYLDSLQRNQLGFPLRKLGDLVKNPDDLIPAANILSRTLTLVRLEKLTSLDLMLVFDMANNIFGVRIYQKHLPHYGLKHGKISLEELGTIIDNL